MKEKKEKGAEGGKKLPVLRSDSGAHQQLVLPPMCIL